MCHGVAETELAVRRRLDSVVAETELAVMHWLDEAAVPGALRHVSQVAETYLAAAYRRVAETHLRHISLPLESSPAQYRKQVPYVILRTAGGAGCAASRIVVPGVTSPG